MYLFKAMAKQCICIDYVFPVMFIQYCITLTASFWIFTILIVAILDLSVRGQTGDNLIIHMQYFYVFSSFALLFLGRYQLAAFDFNLSLLYLIN